MTPEHFDLLGPLPSGTTLLEASAGTGKTYTIAALATRYIAQGVTTIDKMLLITFGRGATRELRERVRETLTRARHTLRTGEPGDDALLHWLNTLRGEDRTSALDRVTRAIADFDAGTIVTTHSFCQAALRALGLHADADPGETFVENITDLVDEVVEDFYVRRYAVTADVPQLTLKEARRLARSAVADPQADLNAGPTRPKSVQETRVAFATAVRAEVLRRRRARKLLTFDDLILRLRDALVDPDGGAAAAQRLQDLYHVILVDEFQDTDPAQWTVLREAFHGHRTLILIGDPKQAIYKFRGADIYSYLAAAGLANNQATLPTNWRSDAAVVEGVQALMGGLELGEPEIVVRPVTAAHGEQRLTGVPESARVWLRTVCPEDAPLVDDARAAVAADVAQQIVRLLDGPARIDTGDGPREIAPADIAVLVGKHTQANAVRKALSAVGVPAVTAATASVFATPAADQWATLFAAMQRPRGALLRDAALTDFFGYEPLDLATRSDEVDADVAVAVRSWAQVLETHSVAQMVATIERDRGLAQQVLSRPDGERHLTDLRHVASAAHVHQRATRLGVVGLNDWLSDQIRRAHDSGFEPTRELTRRLATDTEAVQVLTIHTSKGLEFPIAFVPFGWDRFPPSPKGPLTFHDRTGKRVLDLRGEGTPDRRDLLQRRDREDAGESLRLLYVALTRASSLLVVHWASSQKSTAASPLHRALCARDQLIATPDLTYPVARPPVIDTPWVAVQEVEPLPQMWWTPRLPALPELTVAAFTRSIDTTWRRTSYSGLTRAVHEAERSPASFREDEPDDAAEPVTGLADDELASPFAQMPAGAAFGTLVHAVLEVADTQAMDLISELTRTSAEQLLWHPVPELAAEDLAAALAPVVRTPMGPLAGNLALADITSKDRLAEMDFELPLGGCGVSTLADIGDLLTQHLPASDPLAHYPARMAAAGLSEATLIGFLTGSIDAVLRLPGDRFAVVDYKTNLLRDPARPGAEALVSGYRPNRLATAMMEAHYPLQALLYSAALHRYLRWRLPGYDPERHLGGVLYLFLRGMAGPDTPGGSGVFAWQPPPAMIVALSDLLDGRAP